MYLYEMHVHSSECSACGCSTVREMVARFKEAGYAGFVLTNHFVTGNSSVPKTWNWNDRVKRYYDTYLEAKKEGEHLDFDVLFGIEHHYGNGKEILTYGIDLEFLQSHPELENVDVDTYAKLVKDAGGLLVHAHPHRKRNYIPEGIAPRYDVCDGIEVYNSGDDLLTNELAYQDAVRLNKFMISGGDNHSINEERIGRTGNFFEHRIKTAEELITALKNKEGYLLFNGKQQSHQ